MKVFYRKKNENAKTQQKLAIDNEKEPASKIGYLIKVQENLENSLLIVIYDNKSGYQYKDSDLIQKDSFLEFETMVNVPTPPVVQAQTPNQTSQMG